MTDAITIQNHCEPEYCRMYDELVSRVFHFSFRKWFELNAWDDSYESNSIIRNGKMLSNVSVCRMKLLLDGRHFDAIQLGSVATLPEYRGQGMLRRIMSSILQRYRGIPVFLFANGTVLDFYPKFGFRQVTEQIPVCHDSIDNSLNPHKLPPEKALHFSRGSANRSIRADSEPPESVYRFHFHLLHADELYQIGDKLLLVARQEGETLDLFDIFTSGEVPDWKALKPELPFSGVRRIRFHFTPDRLNIPVQCTAGPSADALFVLGDLPFPARFKIPELSRT